MSQQVAPEIIALAQDIKRISDNLNLIVTEHNKWVAKIQGIDTVAFAALALHGGKDFVLSEENVVKYKEDIQKVVDTMERYKEEQLAKQKKAEKKPAKSKILTAGKRPNVGKILT